MHFEEKVANPALWEFQNISMAGGIVGDPASRASSYRFNTVRDPLPALPRGVQVMVTRDRERPFLETESGRQILYTGANSFVSGSQCKSRANVKRFDLRGIESWGGLIWKEGGCLAAPAHPNNQTNPPFRQNRWRTGGSR